MHGIENVHEIGNERGIENVCGIENLLGIENGFGTALVEEEAVRDWIHLLSVRNNWASRPVVVWVAAMGSKLKGIWVTVD